MPAGRGSRSQKLVCIHCWACSLHTLHYWCFPWPRSCFLPGHQLHYSGVAKQSHNTWPLHLQKWGSLAEPVHWKQRRIMVNTHTIWPVFLKWRQRVTAQVEIQAFEEGSFSGSKISGTLWEPPVQRAARKESCDIAPDLHSPHCYHLVLGTGPYSWSQAPAPLVGIPCAEYATETGPFTSAKGWLISKRLFVFWFLIKIFFSLHLYILSMRRTGSCIPGVVQKSKLSPDELLLWQQWLALAVYVTFPKKGPPFGRNV